MITSSIRKLVLAVLVCFMLLPLLVSGGSILDTLLLTTNHDPAPNESQSFEDEFPIIMRDEKISIELVSSDYPEQLTYENEHVRVQVGCDQYLAYLDVRVNDSSWPQEYYREEFEELKASVETGSCEVSDITLGKHVVADLLELGTASVYDKRNQKSVRVVKMWAYAYFCGPLCGSGTRSFYLPDGTLFLEVMDWIS